MNSGGTALTAIALTVGAILFGGAAGILGQDTNLFWDDTNNRLGVGNASPTVALDVTGAIKASTAITAGNGLTVTAGGIAVTGNSTIAGTLGGVTTLTASTSVVTPLVDGGVGILKLNAAVGTSGQLQIAGTTIFAWNNSAFVPQAATNTLDLGIPSNTLRNVFATAIDSGTAAQLLLKTNNGAVQVQIPHIASAVNFLAAQGAATGGTVALGASFASADTDVPISLYSKGAGVITLGTNAANSVQLQILHTASATRNITITGSNGGNPTIGVTAGSLAITPAVVMASSLVWGTGVANFGTITKRKTADESVTSSTTFQDDDHLTFAIAANEEWVATFFIDAGGAIPTTGLRVAVTTPAGATLNATGFLTTDSQLGAGGRTTTSGTIIFGNTPATGVDGRVQVQVWVLNGANAGSITLQWAQNVSSGTALTFRKGSYMHATRIA